MSVMVLSKRNIAVATIVAPTIIFNNIFNNSMLIMREYTLLTVSSVFAIISPSSALLLCFICYYMYTILFLLISRFVLLITPIIKPGFSTLFTVYLHYRWSPVIFFPPLLFRKAVFLFFPFAGNTAAIVIIVTAQKRVTSRFPPRCPRTVLC